MTLPQAAKRLGLHPAKLRRRLKHGVLPAPTFVNGYGLNFFDEDWLKEARTILVNSSEGEEMRQQESKNLECTPLELDWGIRYS